MTHTTFKICTRADESEIGNFLWSIKNDLLIGDKHTVKEITKSVFGQGGFLAGYKHDQMVALMGHFLGEPSRQYLNKGVGFIYLTALAESVRMTRTARQGLHFTMETLKTKGIQEVRFHAQETDAYTNRLYAHFAQPLGKERNRRGYSCILYAARVDNVLAWLDRPK